MNKTELQDFIIKCCKNNDINELRKINLKENQDIWEDNNPYFKPILDLTNDNPNFNIEILRLLLDSGANPNEENESAGFTPLWNVSFYSNIQAAQLLIQYGADVNKRNKFDAPPLANSFGNSKLNPQYIIYLLRNGANIYFYDCDNWSFVDYAKSKPYYIKDKNIQNVFNDILNNDYSNEIIIKKFEGLMINCEITEIEQIVTTFEIYHIDSHLKKILKNRESILKDLENISKSQIAGIRWNLIPEETKDIIKKIYSLISEKKYLEANNKLLNLYKVEYSTHQTFPEMALLWFILLKELNEEEYSSMFLAELKNTIKIIIKVKEYNGKKITSYYNLYRKILEKDDITIEDSKTLIEEILLLDWNERDS